MAKAVFLSGNANLGGTIIAVTNLDWSEITDVIDTTDLSTILNLTNYTANKKKASFTLEGWKDLQYALPARGTEFTITLDWEGYEFSGSGIINNVTVNGVFDTAVRLLISGVFTGEITETTVAT